MPRINLTELAEQSFGTSLEQLDDRHIYKLLVKLVQERSAVCPLNNGKKKLYYISAEFLIGKLLINNMIDLGIYNEVRYAHRRRPRPQQDRGVRGRAFAR